ncbi:hypothetical protein Dimus_030070, partial [Dionaea muscipula]
SRMPLNFTWAEAHSSIGSSPCEIEVNRRDTRTAHGSCRAWPQLPAHGHGCPRLEAAAHSPLLELLHAACYVTSRQRRRVARCGFLRGGEAAQWLSVREELLSTTMATVMLHCSPLRCSPRLTCSPFAAPLLDVDDEGAREEGSRYPPCWMPLLAARCAAARRPSCCSLLWSFFLELPAQALKLTTPIPATWSQLTS